MYKLLIGLALASIALWADVTGTWLAQVETSAGSGTPTFVLTQKGEALTGSYSGALGEAKLTGTVKGEVIQWTVELDQGKLVYQGKITGDKIEGTVDLAGQASGTFTASKKK